jgi:SNF2 family DNA or RNA helicase
LQNNVMEMWALLNFLEPDKFSSAAAFEAQYGQLESQEQVQRLQGEIMPHLLRRVKEDVEHSIPKKEETIIDVELTTLQVPTVSQLRA